MQKDTAIHDIIRKELERQRNGIELIASENFASLEVIQTMGNVMNNKYAEGYPGRRYYGGCEFVDQTEQLAIDRVKQLSSGASNSLALACRRQCLTLASQFGKVWCGGSSRV